MHTYSTDNELRPRVYWGISTASHVAAGAVGAITALVSSNLPIALGASVGAGVLFRVLLTVYDKRLWDTRPLRYSKVTKVPNLNGEWEGWLKTDYDGPIDDDALHENNDSESEWQTLWVKLHIEQTWRKININLETANSHSDSNGATILTDDGRWPSITYQYTNVGSVSSKDDMGAHDGTTDLKIKNDDTVLEGHYYTGPGRGNSGKVWLKRIEDS